VAGSQRRHLVEKEQLRVTVAPDPPPTPFEIQPAADPRPARPAPTTEALFIFMNAAAAVAHQQSPRRAGEQVSEGIDTAGERHGNCEPAGAG